MVATMNAFGWRLRYAREQKNIDMNELARRVGTSSGVFSHWENGDRSPRDLDTLKRITKELDVTFNWLVDGEEPMRPDGTRGPAVPDWITHGASLAQTVAIYPRRWTPEIVGMAERSSHATGTPEKGWKAFLDDIKKAVESHRPGVGESHAARATKALLDARETQLAALGAEAATPVKRGRGRPRKNR